MVNNTLNSVQRTVKNWWISLVVGILSIVLGILFLLKPLDAWITLIILFIVSFFIIGISQLVFSISNRKILRGWGWTLAGGILSILVGCLLLNIPTVTPTIMIYFVGFWIMFQSIWAIGVSVELQRWGVKGWGWLLALAILGLLFSFMFIFTSPFTATGFIVIMAAASFIAYGVFSIYLSVQLKSIKNQID